MKIICKLNAEMYRKLPHFIAIMFVFLGVILCLTTLPVWAAEAPESEQKDDEVVTQTEENPEPQVETTEDSKSSEKSDDENTQTEPIKEVIIGDSDFMDRDQKSGITILTGNVKTVRLNEEEVEIGFLNADKVTLKSDTKTGETIEIIAEGNVEIRDQDIFATCDHATMNNLTNIIVLKDNVVVLQNEDRLETKLFTLNRTTGKQTGVGDVKFKVTVTQASPPDSTEESEEPSAEGTDDSSSNTSDKDSVSPDSEKETEKKPNSETDEEDKEEKSNPTDAEKEGKESKNDEDTESAETEDKTETTDTEKDTEPTEPAETEEDTEPTDTEEESEDTEEPEEKE